MTSNKINYNEMRVKFIMIDGECTAIFLDEKFSHSSLNLVCYAHNGQHGSIDYSFKYHKRAKPSEYYPLLKELRSIYENEKLDGTITILKVI